MASHFQRLDGSCPHVLPRSARTPGFWRFYFACFNIAAAAAACCFCASCPVAYVCTAYVTPKLIEISSVKPKRKRVNELRGLDCIGLLYPAFSFMKGRDVYEF